jgi:hypothetical protein
MSALTIQAGPGASLLSHHTEGSPNRFRLEAQEIAERYWKDPTALISDDFVQKVNLAIEALTQRGYQLEGIKSSGDCFFEAFYYSYLSVKGEFPPSALEEDPFASLRSALATLLQTSSPTRSQEIAVANEWVHAEEGWGLCSCFQVSIW